MPDDRVRSALTVGLVCSLIGAAGMAYIAVKETSYANDHPYAASLANILAIGTTGAAIGFLGLAWVCHRLRG